MKPISKIDTLFQRNDDFSVDPTRLTRPVLNTISGWSVTEKVDGTSMRIGWGTDRDDRYNVPTSEEVFTDPHLWGFVAGKSDNASIHPGLLAHCRQILVDSAGPAQDIINEYGLTGLTLYGEGYGAKIQNGGKYRKDQGFIVFDVRANSTYLGEQAVTDTADRLGVPRVPVLGYQMPTSVHDFGRKVYDLQGTIATHLWTLEDIIRVVQAGFPSLISEEEQPAEGIVARTVEPLYDNRGERLIIKLKARDFRKGKR